jgi:hypothetical protein
VGNWENVKYILNVGVDTQHVMTQKQISASDVTCSRRVLYYLYRFGIEKKRPQTSGPLSTFEKEFQRWRKFVTFLHFFHHHPSLYFAQILFLKL